MKKNKIAIVVPNLLTSGGVTTVANFFFTVIKESTLFEPFYISIASCYNDSSSVHIRKPNSWMRGTSTIISTYNNNKFKHFGSLFSELEFMYYMPKKKLTEELNKYDIIQIVAGSPAWAYIARNIKKPVVLQVATLVKNERSEKLRKSHFFLKIWRLLMTMITSVLEKKAIRIPQTILVENEWMANWAKKNQTTNNVFLIPPGIDTDLFKPINYYKRKNNYILTVGRMSDPRKNLKLLLKSYSILAKKIKNPPYLMLAGKKPPNKIDLIYAKSLNILDRIIMKQNLDVKELIEIYQNALMFISSSTEEGFGMVLIEAMACGIPVVSTNCGGPSIIIENGISGYLTPLNDTYALTVKIQKLLKDEENRINIGLNARKRIEETFAQKKIANQIIERYISLINLK